MGVESPLLISLPQRGLRIMPPEETRRNMEAARGGQIVTWSPEERARLRMLVNCTILAKRHPTPKDGVKYMESVDYSRREQLLEMAVDMKETIVESWREINPSQEIAVLLYGSIVKGLVRRGDHPDPSNIDLSVIGTIADSERDELFDSIRSKRCQIQQQILTACPMVESSEKNPGNAGVIIQDVSKLVKGGYGVAKSYITACATPLYDPTGIWRDIEMQTLRAVSQKLIAKK